MQQGEIDENIGMKNPYQVLGISAQASQEEIKNAYRKLAKKFHPDLNPGNKAAETTFKDISNAYELIGTPEARTKFDRGETEEQLRHAQEQAQEQAQHQGFYHQGGGRYSQAFEGMDEDIFAQLFGGRGGAGRAGKNNNVRSDEIYQLNIDFKDAVLGAEKEITFPSGKKLSVKIPAGMESGQKLRFAGQGMKGNDAYVQITVLSDKKFTRQGQNIETELQISAIESLIGAEVKVPTLDGAVMLKIPPSVSSGQKLRVAGKGIKAKGIAGDLLVKIKIVNPSKVSVPMDENLKTQLAQWQKFNPFDPRLDSNVEG